MKVAEVEALVVELCSILFQIVNIVQITTYDPSEYVDRGAQSLLEVVVEFLQVAMNHMVESLVSLKKKTSQGTTTSTRQSQ